MKGRNKDLIEKRNKKLCIRYWYWTETKRLRFDDALKVLSEEEFFITEERILAIIREASRSDVNVKAFPKIKVPHLTYRQLSLFSDDAGFPAASVRR